MVKIEIDGKVVTVNQGSMIIEVADELGISIPRFCYHNKLSIAANCRMCLVEVENAPKPLPACATPVSEGMKIHTQSSKAKDAQKSVMEFLLINHPLDCPICDQGGQCELQDIALGYGKSYSRYCEGKRSVEDKNLGPLISTDMTRCIHCTRCVRFGQEISGVRELGATGRGEDVKIGTFIEQNVNSELSGNVIDLCPVGALTSKPFRYKARAWELIAYPGISYHDSVGSNVYYHTQRGKILKVTPRENEQVNEIWLSDRDRFSFEALGVERLEHPIVKENGQWRQIPWEKALPIVAEKLGEMLQSAPDSIGALMSPNTTCEEAYLIQKLLRAKGCHNVDHRLRQVDFSHQTYQSMPGLGDNIESIDTAQTILLIGCDIRYEVPVISARIRKAQKQGANICAINPFYCDFIFDVSHQSIAKQGDLESQLLAVIKAYTQIHPESLSHVPSALQAQLAQADVTEQEQGIAQALNEGSSSQMILGSYASKHPNAAQLYYLTAILANMSQSKYGELSQGANSAGCWLMGAVPHTSDFAHQQTQGLNADQMITNSLKGYLLFQVEPDYDCLRANQLKESLQAAEMVVAFSAYDSPNLREHADFILPISPPTETPGTFINAQGDWQSFRAVCPPLAHSKPLWKVLRVIGNLWDLPDMQFNTLEEVQTPLQEKYKSFQGKSNLLDMSYTPNTSTNGSALMKISFTPIYAVDMVTRRATSLQQTALNQMEKVWLNQQTASYCGVEENDWVCVNQKDQSSDALQVVIDPNVPDQVILVADSIGPTKNLGPSYEYVELQKEQKG